jgi:hypothetical protein
MKDIKKHLHEVISVSLNSDQINQLASAQKSGFDLHKLTGFGKKLAIPSHAAAEALINNYETEEDLVEFFELMLEREGQFVYDSILKIVGKVDFIRLLEKKRWIYDPDLKRFFRDQFFLEKVNLFRSLETINLREDVQVDDIIDKISRNKELILEDPTLEWHITAQMYDLQNKSRLLETVLRLLLASRGIEEYTPQFFTAIKELAVNASKALYKVAFEKYETQQYNISARDNYHSFLQLFREEIEERGDSRLREWARKEDLFFEIKFRHTERNISCWISNNTGISRIEKMQLMKKLGYNLRGQELPDTDDDEYREGAGLGIALVIKILHKFINDPQPLKLVFYPSMTKVGFVIPLH